MWCISFISGIAVTVKEWHGVKDSGHICFDGFALVVLYTSRTSISSVCSSIKGIPGRFIDWLHVLYRCQTHAIGGSVGWCLTCMNTFLRSGPCHCISPLCYEAYQQL